MGRGRKRVKKTPLEKLMEKRLTRKEFIKYSILAAATISLGAWGLNFLKLGGASKETFKRPVSPWKWSKEAYDYVSMGENVKCMLCPNGCILEDGERGFCRVRTNYRGKLYSLVYGNPAAVHVDPVEKKPLFHFFPQTTAFSIATAGCNFRCLNCQNWEISQAFPEDLQSVELMPEEVVKAAIANRCKSIAYTYSEPVVFYEYMYDTSKLASRHGLKNLWITNGYINEKPLRRLCKYLHAANVDVKSFSEKIYNELNSGTLEPVLRTLKVLKEEKVWFEMTNLVVPTYTDDLEMIAEMVEWIKRNLGSGYPLHFSRFYPHYKLTKLPPTPVDFLENARKMAMDKGLDFVYIGNVPGVGENTYCPKCGKLLVERMGYNVLQNNVEDGYCKFCGERIPGVWG